MLWWGRKEKIVAWWEREGEKRHQRDRHRLEEPPEKIRQRVKVPEKERESRGTIERECVCVCVRVCVMACVNVSAHLVKK